MPISMGFSSYLWHFSILLGFSPTCTTVENARQSHLKWPSTIALQSGATPKSSLDHFIVNLWWRQGILHFQKPPSCIHMFAMMIFDDDRSKDGFVDVVLLVTLQAIYIAVNMVSIQDTSNCLPSVILPVILAAIRGVFFQECTNRMWWNVKHKSLHLLNHLLNLTNSTGQLGSPFNSRDKR